MNAFALRLLRRMVDVQPQEVRATLLGFAWFFCPCRVDLVLMDLRLQGENGLHWRGSCARTAAFP